MWFTWFWNLCVLRSASHGRLPLNKCRLQRKWTLSRAVKSLKLSYAYLISHAQISITDLSPVLILLFNGLAAWLCDLDWQSNSDLVCPWSDFLCVLSESHLSLLFTHLLNQQIFIEWLLCFGAVCGLNNRKNDTVPAFTKFTV